MINTTNLNLNKPELTDTPDITAINPNWDTIDSEIQSLKNNKLDKSLLPTSLPANGGDAETLKGRDICTEVDGLKLSVSSGKQKIATAITDKGVSATGGDSFDILATKISSIAVDMVTKEYLKQKMVNLLYYTLHYSFDSYWCTLEMATEMLEGAIQSGQVKGYGYNSSFAVSLKGYQFVFILGGGYVTHTGETLDTCGTSKFRGYLLKSISDESYNVAINSNGSTGKYYLVSI